MKVIQIEASGSPVEVARLRDRGVVVLARGDGTRLSIDKALAENERDAVYRLVPTVDLSRHVLAFQPHRLLDFQE